MNDEVELSCGQLLSYFSEARQSAVIKQLQLQGSDNKDQ